MSIYTSLLTAGTNSHAESSENANAVATDLLSAGVNGVITNTSGVAPMTGSFAVNAQGSPNMTVAVSSGVAYVIATPASQDSQNLRVRNTASANVTISANSSGSTKYDWLYIKVDATKAANPASDASDVATLVTSRSSSSTTDNGTPPTYGTLLAVITVANGASSITNSNIADLRVRSVAVGGINDTNGNEVIKVSATSSAVNEITITNAATGNAPQIAASGNDTNIDLKLAPKGTGAIKGVAEKLYNPYKFSVYRASAQTLTNGSFVKINYDTENFDTSSNFDPTTNHNFTAPIAGFYYFVAHFQSSATASNTRNIVSLFKNSAEALRGFDVTPTSGSIMGGYVEGFLQLAANDTVDIRVDALGANTVLDVSASTLNYFMGWLVSAT